MSRPEHLPIVNTPEGIRAINEAQRQYDKDPQEYERREKQEQEERERQQQEEQEEQARWREHEEERIQDKVNSDLPF